MPSSCKDIRAALARCLQESECVMKYRNTPADCLKYPLNETLPTQCQQLKTGYSECRKGMIDMRKRFRGNRPIATSLELEAGGNPANSQLYAGRPAFNDAKSNQDEEPKET